VVVFLRQVVGVGRYRGDRMPVGRGKVIYRIPAYRVV
jgi:hypothetical protein